jgi:hypothetical protein
LTASSTSSLTVGGAGAAAGAFPPFLGVAMRSYLAAATRPR